MNNGRPPSAPAPHFPPNQHSDLPSLGSRLKGSGFQQPRPGQEPHGAQRQAKLPPDPPALSHGAALHPPPPRPRKGGRAASAPPPARPGQLLLCPATKSSCPPKLESQAGSAQPASLGHNPREGLGRLRPGLCLGNRRGNGFLRHVPGFSPHRASQERVAGPGETPRTAPGPRGCRAQEPRAQGRRPPGSTTTRAPRSGQTRSGPEALQASRSRAPTAPSFLPGPHLRRVRKGRGGRGVGGAPSRRRPPAAAFAPPSRRSSAAFLPRCPSP